MWVGLERLEGVDEGGVALADGAVEAIVGRLLLGDLPDALDAIELGRVGRESEQLDAMAMPLEPLHAFVLKVVARSVVDDEEDLPRRTASNQLLEEVEEGGALKTDAN